MHVVPMAECSRTGVRFPPPPLSKYVMIIYMMFMDKLKNLFKNLKSIGSRAAAMEIEQKIWDIWITHPSDRKLTQMLSKGSSYMSQNRLGDAYIIFTEIISLDKNWAEAWNKRATVLYLMGEFEKSQKDIDKVLSLEKRHFGALSGQGLVPVSYTHLRAHET